jgi:NAD(P)H-dependent flavin oxidoreductase YrpB (nitropropane dioxygenase family)
MNTAACRVLGIDLPIVAFSHCRDVVAAVSRAGGLGVLGAGAHAPEELEVDLKWIDENAAGRPYGVDVLLPEGYDRKEESGLIRREIKARLPEEHRAFVEELLDRYAVPPLPPGVRLPGGPGMQVSPESVAELVDVAFGHDIKLIASALGSPPPAVIDRAHDAGVVVAALAGSAEHAERHVAKGVDLVVAQGCEAGGHVGRVATMVLVPEVVDAVAPVPVLAAGGIGRGRQVAAALALGASGVWTGSLWLTTQEAETHPAMLKKFLAAGSGDTVVSRSFTGKTVRMLRSAWTDEWARPDTPDPLPLPLQPVLIGRAVELIERAAHQGGSGAEQLVTYPVGQIVGSLTTVRSAHQVVLDVVEEFIDVVTHLGTLLEEEDGT